MAQHGWFMPINSRRFHLFSGEGRSLTSACRKYGAYAGDVMGYDLSGDKDACPACVKKHKQAQS